MCKRNQSETYMRVNALSGDAQTRFFLENIVVGHYL